MFQQRCDRSGAAGLRSVSPRLPRDAFRAVSVSVSVLLALTLLGERPAWAKPAEPDRPRTLSAQQVPSTQSSRVLAQPRPRDLTQGAGSARRDAVLWPTAGTAEVGLTATAADPRVVRLDGGVMAPVPVRAGRLPVWLAPAAGAERVSAPSRVRVRLLDRAGVPAVWRDGVVLELTRADGADTTARANIGVGYASFAGAFGGDWAARLRLVRLPACALATPGAAGCRARPLPSRNDAALRRVSTDVAVAGEGVTLLALTSGSSGSAGDFTASSLQASSTWSAGGSSGSFSWNYPLPTPPSLGGPAPTVSLAYSSAAVDGLSEATNNQPSWVGEGFDWWPGFVERRYKPCADDMGGSANNSTATGDMCWGTDNASMSLSGSGGELVKDDATGTWRLKNDDGSRVERLTNTVNGDNNNEYWKITTSDGTQYFFGRNRLAGYTGIAPANKTTNSTWTVPVAGNHDGEPCHATSFASSFCQQAWRWNLDYVVDVHGNTMSLFYTSETNRYARNNTDTDAVSYVRGGWLDHIDYGTDNRSGTDTGNTFTAAPMRVQFDVADRCLASCWNGSDPNTANWTDTPWDQRCTGTSCVNLYSPTFWTTKRLTSITTRVWNAAGSAYKDVDGWTLTHTFPDPGDGTRAGLWLESIVHTGKATGEAVVGGPVSLPEINFDWVQMPNRVDTTTDGTFPMNWMRMSTIWTETGAKIDIRYTGQDCIPNVRMPASPATNTLRCYPVVVQRPDRSLATEYFHKYLITDVTESDRTGGGPSVVTSYEYVGAPAWRHTDDDGITRDNRRTWSAYRGYARVNTRVGDPGSGTQTLSSTVYFRGMHGDLDGSGATRTVTLPALDLNGDGDLADAADAPAVNDSDTYAGMARQSTVFNGAESDPISTTVADPWQSPPTASRDMGQTTVYARRTATRITWVGARLASGAWRVSRAETRFDSYAMPVQVDDDGDVAVGGDESCVKTTYARNTDRNLLTLTARVETYAAGCATAPGSDADVISDSRTSFDGQPYGATPSKGDPSTVEVAKAWTGAGGPVWLTQSTSVYDDYGRLVDVSDVRGNHTTTAYTPPTGGPITAVATTTPLGTSTTIVEPSWGRTTATVDMNNKRTEASFDALGRTRAVWLANRVKASFPSTPSSTYSYLVRNSGGVNVVSTASLNAASTAANAHYTTSYALLDGLLRPRQTQTQSMANGTAGTVLTEAKYDGHGRAVSQSQYYDSSVQPGTDLLTVADWQPKTQTVTLYDRAARATASIFRSSGVEKWRTTTIYSGDRVSVVPPQGGTATTTITDAQGRTVEIRQYHDPSNVGSDTRSTYDAVSYHFDRKGDQDRITDNAGNVWTFTADLLGRQTATHDPDKGDSSATYNDVGDLVTGTDARGNTLAFDYDALGRPTGAYAGTVAPANRLASWVYDPPGFKGQLASSSRWLDNGTTEYKIKIRAYTPLYQPTGEDYIIPAVPAMTGLSGTYTIARGYRYDGSPATISYPPAGGLSGETLTYTYNTATGLPEQLQTNTGQGQYVSNTDYTAYGELTFVQYQMLAGAWLQRALTYDDATHQATQALTIRESTPQLVDDTRYNYDPSGNITKISTTAATGGLDTQCFNHDYATRLIDAWTPATGDCTQARSAAALGGPAPYWQSWTFDPVGNRATETSHSTSGDTSTAYTYPTPGSAQPHAATSVTAGQTTLTYRYDQGGNTTCRPAGTSANTCPNGASSQQLTWDTEGHLATVTDPAGTNTYTYTPDGARFIADDPTATTLYLPGTDIRRTKSTGTVTATRYYTWAGQTCATKTTGGQVTWLIGDHQGTQTATVAAGSQTITTRRQLPYGAARGSVPTWPNPKGFVGGDNDPTGLTHIGARDYDPSTGRFLSADPVLDASEPQQIQGYGYANNSPATLSDPSGLDPCPYGGGGCYYDPTHPDPIEKLMPVCSSTCGIQRIDGYDRRQATLQPGGSAVSPTTSTGRGCGWNPRTWGTCASAAGKWAYQNRGTIATYAALGACVGFAVALTAGAALVGCAIMSTVAFGYRAWERYDDYGGFTPEFWQETVIDLVVTAVTTPLFALRPLAGAGGAARLALRPAAAGSAKIAEKNMVTMNLPQAVRNMGLRGWLNNSHGGMSTKRALAKAIVTNLGSNTVNIAVCVSIGELYWALQLGCSMVAGYYFTGRAWRQQGIPKSRGQAAALVTTPIVFGAYRIAADQVRKFKKWMNSW